MMRAVAVILAAVFCLPAAVFAQEWNAVKGKHFVVYFPELSERQTAARVLREAENYYRKIGDQIGYTRYHNFWTWDARVKILLFPSHEAFVRTTGQPEWSTGFADRDSQLFKSRVIVTYQQEKDFFDGLLPHEISHLVLHDFLSGRPIPIWFDEGVAQLQEASKSREADRIMRFLVSRSGYIPFPLLTRMDIRKEKDSRKVQVFYAQSLSVVEFLIRQYGSHAFADFCRALRDGKNVEGALRQAYTNKIDTISQLEQKWLIYMNR